MFKKDFKRHNEPFVLTQNKKRNLIYLHPFPCMASVVGVSESVEHLYLLIYILNMCNCEQRLNDKKIKTFLVMPFCLVFLFTYYQHIS